MGIASALATLWEPLQRPVRGSLGPYVVQNDVLTAGAPEPETVFGTARNDSGNTKVIDQRGTGSDGDQQLHHGVSGWLDNIEFYKNPFGTRIARPTGYRFSTRVHDADAFVDQMTYVATAFHVCSPLVTAVRRAVIVFLLLCFRESGSSTTGGVMQLQRLTSGQSIAVLLQYSFSPPPANCEVIIF
jgi:hypothetical protein